MTCLAITLYCMLSDRGGAPLVHFKRLDTPVRVRESCRIVLHKGVASRSLRCAGGAAPDVSGPGSAKGDVEYLKLVLAYCVVLVIGEGKHTICWFLNIESILQPPWN